MANSEAIWVPVLPSFKDFSKDMEKGTKGAGTTAGEQIAKELEAAVSKSERAVSAAAAAAEKAQNRVADATGKVRVAQEQYNRALESGDPVKVARAEENLATARRRQGEATTEAQNKSKALAGAQKDLAASQDAVSRNAAEQERAVKLSTLSTEDAERAAKDLDTANTVLVASMAAIVGAAAGAVKGLYDLGSQFDDMFDTIRVGTGASGDAFAGLQDSAMRVAQTIPAMDGGLSQIGTTMADLNTRLGATGEPLETLTGQFVQLANMGVDADINSVSQALSGFGISAADAPAAMDQLFQISQATGLSITELADSAVKGGPQLRQFGFDMADSAALIGSLDKAGLDADKTIAGMSRAMVAFAKDGREPKKALFETITEIENFTAVGNDVAALDLAGKIFGTRGAGQFVDAVKSGQLSVEDFAAATGASSDTILGVADETADAAEQWQLFKQMLAVELAPVAERVFGAIGDSMTWLKDNALPALREMADWVGRNKDVLTALAIAVGSMAAGIAIARAGLLAFTAAQRVMNIMTLLSTKGIQGLNIAMRANVFGLIAGAIVGLVAGLTWFFTSTETGKAIWASFTAAITTGWEWVKNAFAVAWAFIQPILSGLWTALKVVGAILFTAVVTPFQIGWQLISAAVMWAWNSIIKPAWDGMKLGLQVLGQFFTWVWTAVIQPVWNALGAGIAWVWNAIIKPTWDALKFALSLVGAAFSFYWNNVIKPVWDALGAGIKWVWDFVVMPVFEAIKAGLNILGGVFSWAWNSVIKPVWDALGAGIQWVADNVIHPVFNGIQRGLDLVKSAFRNAVDMIGSVWNEMREKTAAPIRFVIDTVYNKGIVAVWNKVAGWLGMDDKTLDVMPLTFASGGVLPGYTPGRDVHKFINPATGQGLHLSGGEAIMRPEWTRAVGGPAAVDRMNRDARRGLPLGHAHANGGVLQFAAGGVLPGWEMLTTDIQRAMAASVANAFPGQRITSGTRYQDVGSGFDNHMAGRAIDFAPSGALAAWIAREYPNTAELFWDPGPNIKNGAPTGAIGGHSDHVHWAMAEIVDPYTGDVISHDGPGGGGGSVIGSLVRSAMDKIMDPIMSAIPEGPGLIGGLGKGFGTKVWDEFKGWILSKVPSAGGSGAYGDWVGTPGVEQFRGLVEKLLKEKGQPLSLVGSVLRRMNQESGGNPNAINLWDSNAAAGIPSKGLMQTIDPTFQAYKDPGFDNIWDPESNIRASMNYALARYGSLSAAYDRAGGYDNGGYLMPGTTLSINETDKPEPVFTNPQWTLIKSLVISTAELLDPIRLMAVRGRDAVRHIADIADNTRRQLDHQIDLAGAAVWAALPGEVKDAVTIAGAVGRQWEKVSGYLNEKAIAWSKGEWPIGSARTPVVEPGPGWEQFRLDDSLEKVARSNMDLAEQVIAGKVSPGNDPVANALFDIFGRDPILPDLARIASMGPNAIEAATDAALHAFETGETARLEEWTASNSQLTEAVLRARDAAILTGEMVQGAVNGYLNWAMASDSQGRQGSWQEYFQHYGGQYGTAQGDWLLSQVGLGGIIGGKFKDSFANLLIETAKSPLLAAPEILDADGRVIGTQLSGTTAVPEAASATDLTAVPEAAALTAPPVAPMPDEAINLEAEPSPAGTQVTVEIPDGKTALSIDEFKEILVRIDERLDDVEIAIDGQADPAPLGLGVGGIA
ncbi:transglycosylase SLT domain-containing protein [Dietzia cinnamea]|uniref:phage tail tape measure protein n=1 Tax=Dietzia cinnamea TaxID=321318 RepID=UPI00223BE4FC|nr:phage tail tape measure protein [Dietzia cinnamea]MCT2299744.1 transglycosylase SLT domain-containing protein [Dietzia cinnamea]